MEQKIQVKGTLPLVASYLKMEEKKVYEIFNLNLKEETEVSSTEKKKGGTSETTNQSKTVRTSKDSI